jgi:hypothetical protein
MNSSEDTKSKEISMDTTTATTLASKMMGDHGLTAAGWKFKFDGATSRLGLCNYTAKTISMGLTYVRSAEPEQVEQTMLHEIAHALVGCYATNADGSRLLYLGQYVKNGHGAAWKMKARQIGYNGKRTSDNPAAEAARAIVVERARAVEASGANPTVGPLRFGDRVATRDRRIEGVIFKVNKVNLTVMNDKTGKAIRVSPSMLFRVSSLASQSAVKSAVGSLINNAILTTPAPAVLPHPVAAGLIDYARVGDTVQSTDGKHGGVVVSVGRTRYHYKDTDGRTYTYPMRGMTVTARGTGAPAPALAEPIPYENIEEGDTVRSLDGRYGGVVVNITSTRFHYTQADGRTATYPRAEMRLESKGEKVPTGETLNFQPGETIILHNPGRKYHGLRVTVESIGPKNIKVRHATVGLISGPKVMFRAA